MAVPRLFFFQAEDGIRDLYVTGVQTCALPISLTGARACGGVPRRKLRSNSRSVILSNRRALYRSFRAERVPLRTYSAFGSYATLKPLTPADPEQQIGRASCRERVEISVVGVA